MRTRSRICTLSRILRARGATLVAACAVVVAVGLASGVAAASAAPATPSTTQKNAAGQQDLFGSLGGGDPFCSTKRKLPGGGTISKSAATDCKVSKSAAEPYPISSYGLDVQTPSTGISSVWNWVGFAFESICSWAWEVALYLIRGVLLLLQWAYTLPLLSGSIPGIQKGLAVMHKNVFGTSWLVAALGVLGLWGMWNGLVRRKTIETVGGVLATLAMMITALVLIAQPHYIGTLAGYSDTAALETLAASSKAQVTPNANAATPVAPSQAAQNTGSGAVNGVVTSEGNLFTSLVLEPWCALEFGDVGYCLARHKQGISVADVWLSFPANSAPRQALYKLATTGQSSSGWQKVFSWMRFGWDVFTGGHNPFDDLKDLRNPQWCPSSSNCPELDVAKKYIYLSGNKNNSQHVQIQGGNSNVFDRMTLLAMVLIGIAGALCVLVWITIKLLFASAKLILLILGLPVMLLVAAFGESGRSTVGSYFKRGLGALVTKLILSIFLAIVLLTYNVLQGVLGHKGAPGWFSLQLIMILFWWGVFLERKVVLQFLEVNNRAVDRGADVSGGQAPFRMTSMLVGGFAVGRLVRGAYHGARAPVDAVRRRSFNNQTARAGAVRELTEQRFGERAAGVIRGEDQAREAVARTAVGDYERDERRLAALKGAQGRGRAELQRIDRTLREGNLSNLQQGQLENDRAVLQRQAEALPDQIANAEMDLHQRQPEINEHRKFLRQIEERNRAEDPRERQRAVDLRRADVAEGMEFPSERLAEDRPRLERSLRWAGQDPAEFDTATTERRDEMLREARATFDADRQRFARVDGPAAKEGLPLGRTDGRTARREVRDRPGGRARFGGAEAKVHRTQHDRARKRRFESRSRRP